MAVYLGGAGTRPEWVPGKVQQRGCQESGLGSNVRTAGKEETDRPVQGRAGDLWQETGATTGYMAAERV